MNKKTMIALATLLTFGQGAWAQTEIEGLTYNKDGGYYDIPDVAALNALATYINSNKDCKGLTFKVTADIAYGEADEFTPIGDKANNAPFNGIFDGGNHTISGIKYSDKEGEGIGLFGYIYNPAVIKNVKLDSSSFTGNFEVGAIAGACAGSGDNAAYGIFDCTVVSGVTVTAVRASITDEATGEIIESPGAFVGGIIGACSNMTLKNCVSAATVKGDDCVGGVTGRFLSSIDGNGNERGIIEDCYSTGSVEGTTHKGDAIGTRGALIPYEYDEGEEYSNTYTKGLIKLTLLDDDSEATVKNAQRLNNYSGLTCDVTLSGRTLYKDGHWNTLYLPFQVTKTIRANDDCPLKDATVMKLASSSFEEGKLTLNFEENTSHTPSNQAYIVKWSTEGDNITDPVFKGAYVAYSNGSTSTTNYVDFKGSYTPKSLADNTVLYLGAEDNLYYPSESTTINAFRGYFQLNGIKAGDIATTRLLFGDDETTGVTTPLHYREGLGVGLFYTLSGRRLIGKPTQKGIYIINGKKTIIK